jgi:hypothetical protein
MGSIIPQIITYTAAFHVYEDALFVSIGAKNGHIFYVALVRAEQLGKELCLPKFGKRAKLETLDHH